jgi:hypothetical protein
MNVPQTSSWKKLLATTTDFSLPVEKRATKVKKNKRSFWKRVKYGTYTRER